MCNSGICCCRKKQVTCGAVFIIFISKRPASSYESSFFSSCDRGGSGDVPDFATPTSRRNVVGDIALVVVHDHDSPHVPPIIRDGMLSVVASCPEIFLFTESIHRD